MTALGGREVQAKFSEFIDFTGCLLGVQALEASGQNLGHLAKPFVGGHAGRVEGADHGCDISGVFLEAESFPEVGLSGAKDKHQNQ